MTETECPLDGNDADDPYDLKGVLKRLGGSQSDHWNKVLVDQTVQTLCKHSNQERQNRAALSASDAEPGHGTGAGAGQVASIREPAFRK